MNITITSAQMLKLNNVPSEAVAKVNWRVTEMSETLFSCAECKSAIHVKEGELGHSH